MDLVYDLDGKDNHRPVVLLIVGGVRKIVLVSLRRVYRHAGIVSIPYLKLHLLIDSLCCQSIRHLDCQANT